MQERIRTFLNESADVKRALADQMAEEIEQAIQLIRTCLSKGGKVLFMGNGGSAADAQHIAAELIGRYQKERRPVPAIALTVDSSILTCVANDYGYEEVFSRQVDALTQAGDVVIGISTSGNSENVIRGLKVAKQKGAVTLGFLGRDGGTMKEHVQLALVVPSHHTGRIQEAHITLGHIICEILDDDYPAL